MMKSLHAFFAFALISWSSALPTLEQNDLINLLQHTSWSEVIKRDDASRRIDVSGDHRYIPADFAAGDIRGPCPGLNALANHGYLPRNGVGTALQYANAVTNVFGISPDFGAFLGIYGAVFDGDLVSWSMGGPPPSSLLSSVPLLGKPQGISWSHNKYEGDASPTRPDLYTAGEAFTSKAQFFQQLYNMQKDAAEPNYDIAVLREHRAQRFEDSISSNPYFFNAPVPGIAVVAAAHSFIPRLMANHTGSNPQNGILSKQTLKDFFGYSGPENALVFTPGTERIPENWYRRVADDYSFQAFIADVLYFAQREPRGLSVGGNTGKTNSFTGVSLGNLTGGVLNGEDLFHGNNALCFVMQFALAAPPDVLQPILGPSGIEQALSLLKTAVGPVMSSLSCPEISKFDMSTMNDFPGFATLNDQGRY